MTSRLQARLDDRIRRMREANAKALEVAERRQASRTEWTPRRVRPPQKIRMAKA